ncbi:MAG: toprim domain-containing protein [Thermoproteota archaeon]
MTSTRRRRGSKEERKLEEVERLISSIHQLDEDCVILVEGRKDKEALRKLGVKGDIFCLLTGKGSLPERLERIGTKRVIVLVDFDPEGELLARTVARLLTRGKATVDLSVWRSLRSYLKSDVRDIEGLATYFLNHSKGSR